MAKRIITLLTMFLVTMSCAVAQSIPSTMRSVRLQKKGGWTAPPVVVPYGLDEDDMLSAYIIDDELVVVSAALTATVTISISTNTGILVVNAMESMSAGSEVSFSIADLPSGSYILEIAFGDTAYVGQFEL